MVSGISSAYFESMTDLYSINSTSKNNSTTGIDEILLEQENASKKSIELEAQNKDLKPMDTKTWEDLVTDEILQMSIENNMDENISLQINQKEAYKAYSQNN